MGHLASAGCDRITDRPEGGMGADYGDTDDGDDTGPGYSSRPARALSIPDERPRGSSAEPALSR